MANLEQLLQWSNFLDQNNEILVRSLKLSNEVLEDLRSNGVIPEIEYQRIIDIGEPRQLERAHALLNFLRCDVAAVDFRGLVAVLRTPSYNRCSMAATLFRNFAESIGHDTSVWTSEVGAPTSPPLFEKPPQLTHEEVTILGTYQFDPTLPTGHIARLSEIQKIRSKFNDPSCNGNAATSKLAIISGIGGVGKSTLASLFAIDVLEREEVDNVIWINTSSIDTVTWDLAKLAEEEFGINSGFRNRNLSPILEVKYFLFLLYWKLCEVRSLIIFDNAEALSVQELQTFLPSMITPANYYRPLVLVTSQPNNWDLLEANVLELELLDDKTAADYVENRLGQYCSERSDAEKLVSFYGNLIIAIEASVSTLLQTNKERQDLSSRPRVYTVSDLLDQVERRQIQVRAQESPGVLNKLRRLVTGRPVVDNQLIHLGREYKRLEDLWTMTFERLETSEPEVGRFALAILDLCCCVRVDEIPVLLLEYVFPPWKVPERDLTKAIQLLKNYSLLQSFKYTPRFGDTECKYLRVHRILQKVRWLYIGSPYKLVKFFGMCLQDLDEHNFPTHLGSVVDPQIGEVYNCLWETLPSFIVFAENSKFTTIYRHHLEHLCLRSPWPSVYCSRALAQLSENTRLRYTYLIALNCFSRNYFGRANAICEAFLRILESLPPSTDVSRELAKVSLLKGKTLKADKKPSEALKYFKDAFERLSNLGKEVPDEVTSLESLKLRYRSLVNNLLSNELNQPMANLDVWYLYDSGVELVENLILHRSYTEAYEVEQILVDNEIAHRTDRITRKFLVKLNRHLARAKIEEGDFEQAFKYITDLIESSEALDCPFEIGSLRSTYFQLLAFIGDHIGSREVRLTAQPIQQRLEGILQTKVLEESVFPILAWDVPDAMAVVHLMTPLIAQDKNIEEWASASLRSMLHVLAHADTDPDLLYALRRRTKILATIPTDGFRTPFEGTMLPVDENSETHRRLILRVLCQTCKTHYKAGNLEAARLAAEHGIVTADRLFGTGTTLFGFNEFLVFRYIRGIVFRDRWITTGHLPFLQEALKTFIGLVALLVGDYNSSIVLIPFCRKCLHALGTVLYHTGDLNLAVQVLYGVWKIREFMVGAKHPKTLESKLWYGKTLMGLGRLQEAQQLLTEVFQASEDQPEKKKLSVIHTEVCKSLKRFEVARRFQTVLSYFTLFRKPYFRINFNTNQNCEEICKKSSSSSKGEAEPETYCYEYLLC